MAVEGWLTLSRNGSRAQRSPVGAAERLGEVVCLPSRLRLSRAGLVDRPTAPCVTESRPCLLCGGGAGKRRRPRPTTWTWARGNDSALPPTGLCLRGGAGVWLGSGKFLRPRDPAGYCREGGERRGGGRDYRAAAFSAWCVVCLRAAGGGDRPCPARDGEGRGPFVLRARSGDRPVCVCVGGVFPATAARFPGPPEGRSLSVGSAPGRRPSPCAGSAAENSDSGGRCRVYTV